MVTMNFKGLSEEQVQAFDRDGYVVASGFFAPHEVEHLKEVFTRQGQNGPVPGLSGDNRLRPDEPLARWPRMMHPHKHPDKPVGALAMKYMLDSRIEVALRQLFREEPIAAQTMFYFKPPGARGQGFHQDNFYLKVKPGNCMAAWVAIDDADEENGAMSVFPGTHKLDLICPQKQETEWYFGNDCIDTSKMEPRLVTLKAGDAMFFDGSLIHGSYPNRSETRFRRAFIGHYIPESCIEVSEWYRPLYRFDGTPTEKVLSTDGGPCSGGSVIKGAH